MESDRKIEAMIDLHDTLIMENTVKHYKSSLTSSKMNSDENATFVGQEKVSIRNLHLRLTFSEISGWEVCFYFSNWYKQE